VAFDNSRLVEANLSTADATGASFAQADLRGAYMYGAILWGADFMRADLRNCLLGRADFWGADLRGANLSGYNREDADLSQAFL